MADTRPVGVEERLLHLDNRFQQLFRPGLVRPRSGIPLEELPKNLLFNSPAHEANSPAPTRALEARPGPEENLTRLTVSAGAACDRRTAHRARARVSIPDTRPVGLACPVLGNPPPSSP